MTRSISTLSLLLFAACAGITSRTDTIHPVVQPSGLAVAVTPEGELGWQVTVRNDTPDLVQLVWDDSTFVTTDGMSMGRLMRGGYGTTRWTGPHEAALSATRGGAAQAPSPIAAGATLVEWVVPESYVGDYGTPPPGRLSLEFKHGDASESWSGDVVAPVPGATPDEGWWCTTSGSGAPSLCAREKEQCDALATGERAKGLEVGECTGADVAACAVQRGAFGVPTTSCFSSMDQCTAAMPQASCTLGG